MSNAKKKAEASAAAAEIYKVRPLVEKIHDYRAEMDGAAVAEKWAEQCVYLKPPNTVPGLVEEMRTWIRANGTRCKCATTTTLPTADGEPGKPCGCRLHWRSVFSNEPGWPRPHNVALLTRFCNDAKLDKKTWFYKLFLQALVLEDFELPAVGAQRYMVLSNGSITDKISAFCHGWIDK